jgi:hypothetical protein
MKFFQLPVLLLLMGSLFLISCGETPNEPGPDATRDPETARIEGELCLMNCSQDAKNRNLTFGKSNDFMKTGEVPTPARQVYERAFILSPVASNPRLLLVGKIRLEVCSEIHENSNDNSNTSQPNDEGGNPDLNPPMAENLP